MSDPVSEALSLFASACRVLGMAPCRPVCALFLSLLIFGIFACFIKIVQPLFACLELCFQCPALGGDVVQVGVALFTRSLSSMLVAFSSI